MKLPLAEGFKEKKAKFIEAGADPAEVDQWFGRFKQLKTRGALQGSEIDIDAYASFDQLKEIVQAREQVKSKTQKKKETKAEGATVVADTPKWLVLSPHNPEASRFYGKGTKWCISAETGNHWCTYRGKLWKHYFFLSKDRPPEDIYYKIALSVKPDGNYDIRDAADADVQAEKFEQVTGFPLKKFQPFGLEEPSLTPQEKWSLMTHKNLPFTEKVAKLSAQEWQVLGERSTLKDEWFADQREQATSGKQSESSWAEWWEQARQELLADPSDEDYARRLEYAMESTAERLADQMLCG